MQNTIAGYYIKYAKELEKVKSQKMCNLMFEIDVKPLKI